ncbi:MAG TPA: MFS transporter [Burkholderiaceae bacterium]|nr:MFS transporter [Burkholderiaceae bacterium]
MQPAIPHRIGLYLALVQFFFATTWTVYVIFLPALAAQVGIPKQAVVFILLLDQVIFVLMDFAMGIMADRVARVVGRLGHVILAVTLVSCAAFLLLPFVPGLRAHPAAPWIFLALTVLWAATSSALRAPPLALLGKYAARSAVPWLAALTLFGLGAASAAAPYLTLRLRDLDPRLPFALSSLALAAATLGIVWVERALARGASTAAAAPPALAAPAATPLFRFVLAVLLVALAAQVHIFLNSAPLYLRHAQPADLPYLTPVFWIGFNLLMLPASLATKRFGGLMVMGAGGAIAAVAAFIAAHSGSLNALVAAQFIAGGGWGCVLMSAVTAAIAIGYTGREGRMTGALFALLALAAVARIAIVASQLDKDAQLAALLHWLPPAAWIAAGVMLLALVSRQRERLSAST